MSKSCCSHQHAAAPIKAVSKAATPQAGHSHTSHCCDNAAQASGVANPTRHDHQGQSGADGPGDEEPPRGACATDTAHDHDSVPAAPAPAPAATPSAAASADEAQLKQFNQRERTNDNAVMHAITSKMSPLEMAAVAEYLSGK